MCYQAAWAASLHHSIIFAGHRVQIQTGSTEKPRLRHRVSNAVAPLEAAVTETRTKLQNNNDNHFFLAYGNAIVLDLTLKNKQNALKSANKKI